MPAPEVGRDARPMLEALRGLRVVAEPAALDGARWSGDGPVVLRSAPDEAFAIGATAVELADGHAIVVEERGWVGVRLDPDELAESVAARLDWPLPAARPALAQGIARRDPGQAVARGGRWRARRRPGGLCGRAGGPARLAPMSASVGRTSAYVDSLPVLRWGAPTPAYDVVIVGGGGHGLATAYYLATRHGITERRRPRGGLHRVGQHRAGTRRSSGRTTASPRRSGSTSTRSTCTPPSRTRLGAADPATRRRACSGSPTPRWRCAPSARAAC